LDEVWLALVDTSSDEQCRVIARNVSIVSAHEKGIMTDERLKKAKPFVLTAAFWLVAGSAVSLSLGTDRFGNVKWMIGLWFLSVADLIVLAMLIRTLFVLVTSPDPTEKLVRSIHISWWLFLKLICLALFGVVLFTAKGCPLVGLLCGLLTMAIVPLVGSLWWSHKESKHARAT
jgi:hypothetical protein